MKIRRQALLFGLIALLGVATFARQAVTNQLTVPSSRLDRHTDAPTANDLAPLDCAIPLDNVITSGNGGPGNDLVAGSDGIDILNGNDGNDCVVGGGGTDTLNGGADDDIVLGGEGADILNGGPGSDIVDGGPGLDTCSGLLSGDTFISCEVMLP